MRPKASGGGSWMASLICCFVSMAFLLQMDQAEAKLSLNLPCNYTLFERTGCEHDVGAECVDDVCLCKPHLDVIVDGRFCVAQMCSKNEFYDDTVGKCVPKRRASVNPEENYCRYDFHCRGKHVKCKRVQWNHHCQCINGFRYDSFEGECTPMYGIGGYCLTDADCDATELRKIQCLIKEESGRTGGTCQCFDKHVYNYHIDGCESDTLVAQRKFHMRSLIFIFIVAGIIFGFALTCDFGMFAGRSRISRPEMFFTELMERQQRMEDDAKIKAANQTVHGEATSESAPSPSCSLDLANEKMTMDQVDHKPPPKQSATVVDPALINL